MRFDDIMRYVPVNEDWENRSTEERKLLKFTGRGPDYRREPGFKDDARAINQAEFNMQRQSAIGGDIADIDARFYDYDGSEREFREKSTKIVSSSKRMLRDVFEKYLLPAKDALFNYYSAMEELQKDGFNRDMSGTGRAIGVELRRLVPAVKDAYDAIARIGRMV